MLAKLRQLRENQSGSVIILALFMLVFLIIIVGVVALIILNNLESVTSYSSALQSYYAAESSVERGLYSMQAARLSRTKGVVQTATSLNTLTGTEVSSGASYSLAAVASNANLASSLAVGQTVQYDFFDEDASTGIPVPLQNLANIQVQWTPTCSAGGAGLVELSYSAWAQNNWNDALKNADTNQVKYSYTCNSGSTCTNKLAVVSNFLYEVKLKALQCASSVTTTGLNVSNTTINTHNLITLTGTGTYRNTQQQITATMLWRAPLNNYFDYVLFSQDQLNK